MTRSPRRPHTYGYAALAAALLLPGACVSPTDTLPRDLAMGTWGGEQVGMIVQDTVAHVHIQCTLGDFRAPIVLDETGRFEVDGSYLLKAYPVARGPTMPARLAGRLRGNTLTLTVAVHDTVDQRLVVLGPVDVVYQREPRMAMCPICDRPGDRAPAAAGLSPEPPARAPAGTPSAAGSTPRAGSRTAPR